MGVSIDRHGTTLGLLFYLPTFHLPRPTKAQLSRRNADTRRTLHTFSAGSREDALELRITPYTKHEIRSPHLSANISTSKKASSHRLQSGGPMESTSRSTYGPQQVWAVFPKPFPAPSCASTLALLQIWSNVAQSQQHHVASCISNVRKDWKGKPRCRKLENKTLFLLKLTAVNQGS